MGDVTKKGFDVTIKAFIPFDPGYMFTEVDPQEKKLDPKAMIASTEKHLADAGYENVEIGEPVYRERKKA